MYYGQYLSNGWAPCWSSLWSSVSHVLKHGSNSPSFHTSYTGATTQSAGSQLPSSQAFSLRSFPSCTQTSKYLQIASRIFFTFLFILGVYLGSHPQEGTSSTPGYRTIMRHIPTQYMESNDSRHIFWLAVA